MAFEIWQNFTTDGIINYALSAYSHIEPWLWPLILLGIVGFIYGAMQSLIVAVVGIIIIFGALAGTTDVFSYAPEPTQFAYILAVVGITALLVGFFIKISRKYST